MWVFFQTVLSAAERLFWVATRKKATLLVYPVFKVLRSFLFLRLYIYVAVNPKPLTLNPEILNLTLNLTLNPKPSALNPKPKTLNPRP